MNRYLVQQFARENDGQCVVIRIDDTVAVTTDPPRQPMVAWAWDWYFTDEPESFPWDAFDL